MYNERIAGLITCLDLTEIRRQNKHWFSGSFFLFVNIVELQR